MEVALVLDAVLIQLTSLGFAEELQELLLIKELVVDVVARPELGNLLLGISSSFSNINHDISKLLPGSKCRSLRDILELVNHGIYLVLQELF